MQTDRNLLFGVLALQLELIDARQFTDACCGWAACRDRDLPDLLAERGWLEPDERRQVEEVLKRKAQSGGGSPAMPGGWQSSSKEALSDVDDAPAGICMIRRTGEASTVRNPERRDRYTLLRLHAQGGIGQVWLA